LTESNRKRGREKGFFPWRNYSNRRV